MNTEHRNGGPLNSACVRLITRALTVAILCICKVSCIVEPFNCRRRVSAEMDFVLAAAGPKGLGRKDDQGPLAVYARGRAPISPRLARW
ncbi:MAG: hypothetical protein ABTR27_15875, partial [Candidatus Competibacter phosphatis]